MFGFSLTDISMAEATADSKVKNLPKYFMRCLLRLFTATCPREKRHLFQVSEKMFNIVEAQTDKEVDGDDDVHKVMLSAPEARSA